MRGNHKAFINFETDEIPVAKVNSIITKPVSFLLMVDVMKTPN